MFFRNVTILIGTVVNNCMSVLISLHESISDLLHGVTCCTSYLLSSILHGLKILVILTGNSTILLFTLIPNCLFYTLLGIIEFGKFITEQLVVFISYSICKIVTLLSYVLKELADIPPSSLIAALIAFGLAIFLRSHVKCFWRLPWLKVKHLATTFWNWRIRINHQKMEEEEFANKNMKTLLRQLEREREDKLCIVCQENKKNIVFQPCLHMICCEICTETLSLETYPPVCPVCRSFILSNLKVYG